MEYYFCFTQNGVRKPAAYAAVEAAEAGEGEEEVSY